jgi:hemerythrin superfamily protein
MTPTTMTATDLLRQQHENVKALFEQTIAAEGAEREQVFDCLRATLAVHETAEEMTVHPAARQVGPEGQAVAQARLEEERAAKQQLADLEKLGPDGDGFGVKLVELQHAVLAHAEAEEQELFPLLEQAAGREHLVEMADAIRTAEDMAPTHPHPHAPDSPLGALLVGPFAKMVDAVRERINK